MTAVVETTDKNARITKKELLHSVWDNAQIVLYGIVKDEIFTGRDESILGFLGKPYYMHVIFDNCTFSDGLVRDAYFDDCRFINCRFESLTVKGHSSFYGCSFEHCYFSDVIFLTDIINFGELNYDAYNTTKHVVFGRYKVFLNWYNNTFFLDSYNFFKGNKPSTTYFLDRGVIILEQIYNHFPTTGDFIAWKVIRNAAVRSDIYLVKLLIPADAKKTSWYTDKCRANYAKVLAIYDTYHNELKKVRASCLANSNIETTYEVGKYVFPDEFDEDRRTVCSHGIHFFVDQQEAMDYMHFKWREKE